MGLIIYFQYDYVSLKREIPYNVQGVPPPIHGGPGSPELNQTQPGTPESSRELEPGQPGLGELGPSRGRR